MIFRFFLINFFSIQKYVCKLFSKNIYKSILSGFFGFNMFEFVAFFGVKACLAAHRFDLGISGILSFFLIKAFMASHTMEHQRP